MNQLYKLGLALGLAASLLACGGGGGGSSPAPASRQVLVGDIFGSAAEIPSADIQSTIAYTGNLPTAYAVKNAGKQNMLDMLFMFPPGRKHDTLASDAEAQLIAYANANPGLLVPGVRVLVLDEVYWNPPDQSDSNAVLQPQLDALQAAVALVRKHLPQVKVGITVTPYASFGRPNTLEFIKRAVALVDWVGTDPYWFGDDTLLTGLNAWSRDFHGIAKAARPSVETWYIAQAFRPPTGSLATFNSYMATQLGHAQQYDHMLFFGWQFVSELDPALAGKNFPADTRRLYQPYLKP